MDLSSQIIIIIVIPCSRLLKNDVTLLILFGDIWNVILFYFNVAMCEFATIYCN